MPRLLSQETVDEISCLSTRYPTRLAALVPALHAVQKQLGHVPDAAQLEVAELLDLPPTRVREVVSFYGMFADRPQGRHVLRVCNSISCCLRGAEALTSVAEKELGISCGHTTPDGRVTLEREECLASCGTGPALWCDGKLYENLDEAKLKSLLEGLA